MIQDSDSSASGYLSDSFEAVGSQFTDVEILSTSEVNVVAKAKRYGRWWLLKGLRSDVASESGYQQRLRKELEILMMLQHPAVVGAYGLETVSGLGLCIVMEYVDGVTLGEWLQGTTTRQARLGVAERLAEAVGYVHSRGIAHRDLKPSNIIVSHNGEYVRLIDFGLADTDSHAVLKQPAGTPRYMSPEQLQANVADCRNDVYSLGVIFSQMNLGPGLRHIIRKCLKPIDCRYPNADVLTDAIRGRWKWPKRILIASLLIMMALLLAWTFWQRQESAVEIEKAREELNSMSDSLTQIASANRMLEKKQKEADLKRQRVENAITKGNAEVDRALRQMGIEHHLDTLSDLAYLKMDIWMRSVGWEKVKDRYISQIRDSFTAKEQSEINTAINDHYAQWGKRIFERYNKMKSDYDQKALQGH